MPVNSTRNNISDSEKSTSVFRGDLERRPSPNSLHTVIKLLHGEKRPCTQRYTYCQGTSLIIYEYRVHRSLRFKVHSSYIYHHIAFALGLVQCALNCLHLHHHIMAVCSAALYPVSVLCTITLLQFSHHC